jgi:hypothetical protein
MGGVGFFALLLLHFILLNSKWSVILDLSYSILKEISSSHHLFPCHMHKNSGNSVAMMCEDAVCQIDQ